MHATTETSGDSVSHINKMAGVERSVSFSGTGPYGSCSQCAADRRMNAGRLIRDVIEAKGGSAGGHGTMAGARLPLKDLSAAGRKRLREDVVRSFLDAFGIKARKPKKIVI